MIVVATRGSQQLLANEEDDPRNPNTMGVILDDGQAWEIPIQSALARGYWVAADSSGSVSIDGVEVIPWVRNT